MKRIGAARRKTRHKLSKHRKSKGKISLTAFFQAFKKGDKVVLIAEPAIQKGLYNMNFYGKVGTVAGKQGKCYQVDINDRTKQKTVIVHPVHLKKA